MPALNVEVIVCIIVVCVHVHLKLPCNLSSAMQDNGERRNTLAAHENALFNSVLHKQQQIE